MDVGAIEQSLVVPPRAFVVEGHTETALQAFSTVEANTGAECIGKRVEVDIGIDQLGLRRDGPGWIDGNALAAFQRQCVAKTAIVVGEVCTGKERVEIARVPGHLSLTVQIETALAIPGQCPAKTVTVRADLPIAVNRTGVGFAMGVMDCEPANQLAAFRFCKQPINTGLKFEDILLGLGAGGRETRFDAVMHTFNAAPYTVSFDRNACLFGSGIRCADRSAITGPETITDTLLQGWHAVQTPQCPGVCLVGRNTGLIKRSSRRRIRHGQLRTQIPVAIIR
ncbi:hypothetical protein D3C71_1382800 [compost metagenome]